LGATTEWKAEADIVKSKCTQKFIEYTNYWWEMEITFCIFSSAETLEMYVSLVFFFHKKWKNKEKLNFIRP